MALGRARAGAPVAGTQAAPGTDNSLLLPRIITFSNPVRPCIVTNHCLESEILVKVNVELGGTVSEVFAAPNLGHFVIPPKRTNYVVDGGTGPPDGSPNFVDVSVGGLIAIHSVSFCTTHASDDLDDVSIQGFAD